MDADSLIEQLQRLGDPLVAAQLARYHKVNRCYLGVRVPVITDLARLYWLHCGEIGLVETCERLWGTDIAEARLLVGKLLEVHPFTDTSGVWSFLSRIKDDLDAWAIADHLEKGAKRCILADESRLDEMEQSWIPHANIWVRRATLVYTLEYAKPGRDPDRSLGWASGMVDDREWFIQKAIAWWLRELSKHNPRRVMEFLDTYAMHMKAFAVKEAGKYIKVAWVRE